MSAFDDYFIDTFGFQSFGNFDESIIFEKMFQLQRAIKCFLGVGHTCSSYLEGLPTPELFDKQTLVVR